MAAGAAPSPLLQVGQGMCKAARDVLEVQHRLTATSKLLSSYYSRILRLTVCHLRVDCVKTEAEKALNIFSISSTCFPSLFRKRPPLPLVLPSLTSNILLEGFCAAFCAPC